MPTRRIAFLLPRSGVTPIGGYKVVYEYANRLAADGYEVELVYPAYVARFQQSLLVTCLKWSKSLITFLYRRWKGYSGRQWFPLHERIKEHWVWSLVEKRVPLADVYIATAVQTSRYLERYVGILPERKYYFIQGFENWGSNTSEHVMESYRYPMRKIAIARWLVERVESCGESCALIYNGFDFDYFKREIPCSDRDKFRIAMMYHALETKGCADGFKALEIVKARYPQIEVSIFGATPRPRHLPKWYHYVQRPDRQTHNRIYNEAAIFIGTSWSEGWGLTVGEAMMCGAAVACTDNPGYSELARNSETALVSPIKNSQALAENIIRLLEDDELRCRIAEAGYRNIQQFTWEASYPKFRSLIENGCRQI